LSPAASAPPGAAPYAGRVLPVVKYFLARLVLFVLAVVVLGLLGAGRVLALFGGLVISVMLSYVLLRRLRDPATAAIAERVQARQERRAAHPDEDELFEDAQVDAGLDADIDRDMDRSMDAGSDDRPQPRVDEPARDAERRA
jgi:hypothetical protein